MARRRKSKPCSTNMRRRKASIRAAQKCWPISSCNARTAPACCSECGAAKDEDALIQLDAWLCDLKEMRINDGLHVFGHSPDGALRDEMLSAYPLDEQAEVGAKLDACGAGGNGRSGSRPARRLHRSRARPARRGAAARTCCRPGAIFSRSIRAPFPRAPPGTSASVWRRTCSTAICRIMANGRAASCSTCGAAPRCAPAATISRKALRLLGVRPLWDAASTRMSGFEILPLAQLGRPRIDVTLRISGLFRDVFPQQIEAFDAAVRAVARARRASEENPLAGQAEPRRIFGAAPGAYGVDLSAQLAASDWRDRAELAEKYLAASSHAYGAKGDPLAAATGKFRRPGARRRRFRPCAGSGRAGRAERRRLRHA